MSFFIKKKQQKCSENKIRTNCCQNTYFLKLIKYTQKIIINDLQINA